MTLRHHPTTKVLTVGYANRNNPIPALAIRLAGDIALTDEVVQGKSGVTSTSVVITVGILTCLPGFKRIHTGKTYALAADLDRIAVDHRCLSDDGFSSGR